MTALVHRKPGHVEALVMAINQALPQAASTRVGDRLTVHTLLWGDAVQIQRKVSALGYKAEAQTASHEDDRHTVTIIVGEG